MNSSEASPSIPLRSNKSPKSKILTIDLDPLSAKTPEKPPQLPHRTRNRHAALSLKEVRNAAMSRHGVAGNRSGDREEEIAPARRKIIACLKKERGGGNKLPEKYELLCEFFNNLDNSIRLLRLKGSTLSFRNIAQKIECFTDRRFTYEHLAQLKSTLPEVIEIKKILVFNELTNCMKPDLHVSMNHDAVDNGGKLKSEGGSIYLRKVFQSRIEEFSKTHPEDHDVPKAELPEPFNVWKQEAVPNPHSSDQLSDELGMLSETSSNEQNQLPAVSSHFPLSFQRRFSQKPKCIEVEKTHKSPEVSSLPVAISKEVDTSDKVIISVNETPRKDECTSVLSTPAKLASTPARLMSSTPGLCTPKRSYMSPESDNASTPNKLVKRPPRTRSLKFDSPMKTEEDRNINGSSIDSDILDILSENLLQSIREKESIAMEERDPAISQAKRRRQMIACLPKMFNMIHFVFQSISRSLMTKEELIHKMMSNHFDIVDRSEVEEQLTLLLELVPDWISEKLTVGGDMLIRVDKMYSADSIRARLEEAK